MMRATSRRLRTCFLPTDLHGVPLESSPRWALVHDVLADSATLCLELVIEVPKELILISLIPQIVSLIDHGIVPFKCSFSPPPPRPAPQPSVTVKVTRFPSTASACCSWSKREVWRTLRMRSTWGRCHPSRRPSSALPIFWSRIAR